MDKTIKIKVLTRVGCIKNKRIRDNSQRIQRISFKSRNINVFSVSETMRQNLYLDRVAHLCNKLSEHVISSPSLNSLKSSLYQIYKRLD